MNKKESQQRNNLLSTFDPIEQQLQKIESSREVLRSRTSCRYALSALMQALEKHVHRLQTIEARFIQIDEKYGSMHRKAKHRSIKRKHIPTARKVTRIHKKLKNEIEQERAEAEFFRGLLLEQIQSTATYGHEELSEKYASSLLNLSTPMEEDTVKPETVRLLSEQYQHVLAIWKRTRDKIEATQKAIASVNSRDGSIALATE